MKLIRDKRYEDIILEIVEIVGKEEILFRTDDCMRDRFHTALKIESRYFIRSVGNLAPYQIGEHFTEITKEKMDAICSKSVEDAWLIMDESST